MKKQFRTIAAIAAIAASVASIGTPTAAASGTAVNGADNVYVSSDPNQAPATTPTTIQSTSQMSLGSYLIDMGSAVPAITANDYVRVDDNTGQGAGWKVTVSASDLRATVNDPSLNGATFKVNLPVDSTNPDPIHNTNTPILQVVQDGTLTGVNSSDTTNVSAYSGQVTTSGVRIMDADVMFGQGAYTQRFRYTLKLPQYISIAQLSDIAAGSQYEATNSNRPAQVGLFEGSYSTTVTYTVATGP
ncbi:WxL domain-containing protein [Paenibacillus sp.]|uniref:WxL domain-containing protein n=1 Tax=Paenibacillus sp. TaxID=58172 RepID=UPI002D69689E|nr:WxL domain-containing protein [Paenibacillus sp.]HZG85141.1 WxL domain-containing protein [Paenibacillus sp.]